MCAVRYKILSARELKTDLTDNSDSFVPSQKAVKTAVDAKQDTLVSGTNIKTINSTSILGSGDIAISGSVADGDKGDITVSGTGATWTIDNKAVSLAKMADLAQNTIIGRVTASTGVPEALTAANVRTIINVADGATANAKATGAEVDTGTDDAKFVTAKALVDSSYEKNPMTAAGDIIYGGTSGAPTRLAKGTDGQVLTLASGNPSWATPSSSGSNFAVDPTLTNYFNFVSEWLTPGGTALNYVTNSSPSTYNCYGGYSIIKWAGSMKYANKKFADILSETNGNLYFTSVLRIIANINVKIYNGSSSAGQAFIGFSSDSDGYFETENVSNYPRAGFVFDYQNEKIFAVNANGTNYTKTELTVSSPRNKRYSYIVDFDKANSTIKFYLNGSLVATHTTNIPNPSSTPIGFGFGTNNAYLEFYVSPMIASIKLS